jgi:hypothetical protein
VIEDGARAVGEAFGADLWGRALLAGAVVEVFAEHVEAE